MPSFLDSLKSLAGLFAPHIPPIQTPIMMDDPRTGGLSGNMNNPYAMNMNSNGPNPRAFDMPPDISQVNIGPQDPYAQLRQLYQPEHKYIDIADQMLNTLPTRPKPSFGQKLAGSVYGLAHSPKEVDELMYAPYNRELQDWKMRFDPLMQLANQERYGNQQEGQFARSVLSDQLNRDKLEEVIRNNTEKNKQGQQKINIAQQRANSYEDWNRWRISHPNYDKYIQPDGNVMLIDKNSGDTLDTGIPSNKYDEKQLIALRTQGAKEVAAIPRTTTSSSTTTSPEAVLPTQQKVARYNAAQLLKNTRPDLAEFINLADPGTNEYSVVPPEDHWYGHRGPTQEQFDEINKLIEEQSKSASGPKITTRESTSSRGPVTPSGKPSGSVVPSTSNGTPPPIEQRKEGMQWTFPNGNIGKWNAKDKKWEIVKVVTK